MTKPAVVRPMKADNKNALLDLNDLIKAGHLGRGQQLFGSNKMDGIRAIVKGGVVLSNTLKPIPSAFVQATFGHVGVYEGLDGELICGEPNSPTCYQDTYSAVMTHGCNIPVAFYVFDRWDAAERYEDRLASLAYLPNRDYLRICSQITLWDSLSIIEAETAALKFGYEGLMLRRPDAPYKFGRSTFKEGYLLKLKRLQDAEAEIEGWEELMHNGNEAALDAFGNTKRTSHKENLVPMGTLGAIRCRGVNEPFEGVPFNIGVFKGFSKEQLQDIWNNREDPVWKTRLARFQYQAVGVKDAPRQPRLTGFRDRMDL